MGNFYVYILRNHTRTLYVGITNDLVRRLSEHVQKLVPGFTATYAIDQLAYYERHATAADAIKRETQIKGWSRRKKIALIETMNPGWEDLAKSLVVLPEVPPYTDPRP